MPKSRPIPTIDRTALRNGLILHARTGGFFGRAIRWAESIDAKREGYPDLPFGNHDAPLYMIDGRWWVLDAEPPEAKLTPLYQWERRMAAGKCELRFYWPAGAMSMDGRVACKWWLSHVRGRRYDKAAFPRLLWRAVLGPRWESQAGNPHEWWCTEGTRGGWRFAGFDPWGGNNSTPLDSEIAVMDGRMEDWTGQVMPAAMP